MFLQVFYDTVVKNGVRDAATEIAAGWTSDDPDSFSERIDTVAGEKSLLVLVTDWDGQVLYGTDEHSAAYRLRQEDGLGFSRSSQSSSGAGLSGHAMNSGQFGAHGKGQGRNIGLTPGFGEFLLLLGERQGNPVEFQEGDGSLYTYGIVLPTGGIEGSASDQAASDAVLYLSTTLQPVGATVSAIRIQLVIATIVALVLAFVLAFALSRGFSKPVEQLTSKARHLAKGKGSSGESGNGPDVFESGFCSELDDLASAMDDAREELDKVEERRVEFLANISHDLRTPLTLIRGYAEAARDDAESNDGALGEDLDIIVRESERLSALVNEVLDYSVLKGDAVQLKAAAFDESALVESVAEAFSIVCEREGLSLESDIANNVVALGDESRITRVVYNLVDNAVSHSPEGGKVRLKLAICGDVARFQVSDEGSGIAEDERDQVWDRYFTKKQAKRNKQGSGLGLAISREILEAHHATYGIESAIGAGSTFWFELPVT